MDKKRDEPVEVRQAENEPKVPAEVIAQSIVRLDKGMKKVMNSGLNEEAIIVLLRNSTGLSKREIKNVLDGLKELRSRYGFWA